MLGPKEKMLQIRDPSLCLALFKNKKIFGMKIYCLTLKEPIPRV
jgi:hypothetical protein